MTKSKRILELLKHTKALAKEYREHRLPLGCTGEIAEYEATRLLGLSAVRQAGYDAVRRTPQGSQRLQIKALGRTRRLVIALSVAGGLRSRNERGALGRFEVQGDREADLEAIDFMEFLEQTACGCARL